MESRKPCASASCVSQRQRETRARSADPALLFCALLLLSAASVFWNHSSLLLTAPRQQIGANERLQVAVEHAIHVANFRLRSMILDHAIRLQHVGTNLRSEFDVELRVFNLFRGRALFLHFEFIEF